jgi:hypothetical protein
MNVGTNRDALENVRFGAPLTIVSHESCFDGIASAALFYRFWRDHAPEAGGISLRFLRYGNSRFAALAAFVDAARSSGELAVLDFSYPTTAHAGVWWFDHHDGAFESSEARSAFEALGSPRQAFDPSAPACAELLARVLEERLDYRNDELAGLISWASIIDSARWPDEVTPVALNHPALVVRLVVESTRDDAFSTGIVKRLSEGTIEEFVEWAPFRGAADRLRSRHWEIVELFAAASRVDRGVVYSDLTAALVDERYEKFIPDYLYPGTPYNVAVLRTSFGFKVSVGYNTCSNIPNRLHLGQLCEELGGGGHVGIGAITRDISHEDALAYATLLLEKCAEATRTEP